MEKRVFATVKIDLDEIDARLKAVIEAQEALSSAVYALEQATGLEGFTVQLEKPAGKDGPAVREV